MLLTEMPRYYDATFTFNGTVSVDFLIEAKPGPKGSMILVDWTPLTDDVDLSEHNPEEIRRMIELALTFHRDTAESAEAEARYFAS